MYLFANCEVTQHLWQFGSLAVWRCPPPPPPHRPGVFTVDVLDHVDAEAVPGDGGEHLRRAPSPGQVVGGTPGGDGAEQQLQVVLLGQLLRRRHEGAELYQDLEGGGGGTDLVKYVYFKSILYFYTMFVLI